MICSGKAKGGRWRKEKKKSREDRYITVSIPPYEFPLLFPSPLFPSFLISLLFLSILLCSALHYSPPVIMHGKRCPRI
jgi:hypothetical protein